MKKALQKVALVALVCVGAFFAATSAVYLVGCWSVGQGLLPNAVVFALEIVLFVLYGVLSVYLLYVNFCNAVSVKKILLYCNCQCSVSVGRKVVDNIVDGCVKQVPSVRVTKMSFVEEKQGFSLQLRVVASGTKVVGDLERLRLLLDDGFVSTLGLKFVSINFDVGKLSQKYVPTALPTQRGEYDSDTADEVDSNGSSPEFSDDDTIV